jgi:uncharacterized protein (DUF1015 family)
MIFYLSEGIDFKSLRLKNKSTFPKIPINKVYKNPIVDILSMHVSNEIENEIEGDEYTSWTKKMIPIKDIYPTQKFLNFDNLLKVKDTSQDTDAILLKRGSKYYVADGHHRIAINILKGKSAIKAYFK